MIFVIKNRFLNNNIFRVDIKNPSPRHHAPNPHNPCRIWSFLEPKMRKEHFSTKRALFGPKVTFHEKVTSGPKSQLFGPNRDFTEDGLQKVSRNDSLHSKRSTGDPQDALFRQEVTFWSKSGFWDPKVTFPLKSDKSWILLKFTPFPPPWRQPL